MDTFIFVDDQSVVLETVKRILRKEPFQILTTTSPEEALALVEQEDICGVITDVAMPGMNGIELTRRIKSLGKNTEVILFTGYAEFDYVKEAMVLGAMDFLVKPIPTPELIETLFRVREKYHATKQERGRITAQNNRINTLRTTLVDIIDRSLKNIRQILTAYDPYWNNHSEAMSTMGKELAKRTGCDSQTVMEIGLAARICDIGIVAVDRNALEREVSQEIARKNIERHVNLSRDVCSTLFTNDRVTMIVNSHHENFDGTGINALAGNTIPIGARILRIVDIFHELMSVRPSSEPLSVHQALRELRKRIGKELDPSLTAAFISYVEQNAASLKEFGFRPNVTDGIAEIFAKPKEKAERVKIDPEQNLIDLRTDSDPTGVLPTLSKDDLLRMLENDPDIGAIPFVAGEIIRMSRRSATSVEDIASLVNQDPGITTALLRIANSSIYNTGKQVTDTKQAIMKLGIGGTGEMVAGLALIDKFGDSPNNLTARPQWFWEHCIASGSMAFELAKHLGHENPEELYLVGLFHDMGRAIFDRLVPEAYHPLLRWCRENGESVLTLEAKTFGITHTDLLNYFFKILKLPRIHVLLSKYHHSSPAHIQRDENKKRMLVFALANALVKSALMGNGGDGLLDTVSGYAQALAIKRETVFEAIEAVSRTLNQRKAQFMMHADLSTFEPYLAIVQNTIKHSVSAHVIKLPGIDITEIEVFLDRINGLWTPDDFRMEVSKPNLIVVQIGDGQEIRDLHPLIEENVEQYELQETPVLIAAPKKVDKASLRKLWRGHDKAVIIQNPVHIDQLVQAINLAK